MCWHNAAARKAAQNFNFLCFKLFFKDANSLEESLVLLVLKSACEVSARYEVMKDGRKSLLMVLPQHHRDRGDW